jgi:hypothetical protein
MRAPCGLIALVLLVVGCGSPGAHSAREVERVFLAAGVPFQSEQLPNPDLRPANPMIWVPGPPGSQRSAVAHVQAVLLASDNTTFSLQMAYVFDSTKSADAALAKFPLAKWLESNHPVIRAQVGNVIIVAAPQDNSGRTRRVRRAIAALRAG